PVRHADRSPRGDRDAVPDDTQRIVVPPVRRPCRNLGHRRAVPGPYDRDVRSLPRPRIRTGTGQTAVAEPREAERPRARARTRARRHRAMTAFTFLVSPS